MQGRAQAILIMINTLMDYKIFVDTSFFVSLYDEKDPNHNEALKLSSNLPEEALLYTSSEMISESLTVISQKTSKKRSIDFYDDILPIELIIVDIDTFNKSVDLFKKIKSKNVSFADCTSFVICRELDIDAVLTFDKHFKKQGIKIFQG
jgi:uncharacterized protein